MGGRNYEICRKCYLIWHATSLEILTQNAPFSIVRASQPKILLKARYFQKTRQIIFLAANFFEFWRLPIGCSAESTNQKSPKFKKVHQKGRVFLKISHLYLS